MKLCRVALAISVESLLAACGSSTRSESTTRSSARGTQTVPRPLGNLYQPPSPLPAADAGTLIWAQRVTGIPIHPPSAIWRILYHSRNRDDHDIAVSGFAIVPNAPAPAAGRQVYAWAHGTVGLGDQCAPSRAVRENLSPYGGQQADRGAVGVATDYEGLGTPGIPTSAVGLAEGHAVLDSVRAVASLPNVGPLGMWCSQATPREAAPCCLPAKSLRSTRPNFTSSASRRWRPVSKCRHWSTISRRRPPRPRC